MPDRASIDDFLAQPHVAVVGVSRDSKQFANVVYRHLRSGGRTLYPVNPLAAGASLEGDRSYPSVSAVPEPVDGVLIIVPADAAADVAREAVARGVGRVWLHRGVGQGAVSEEAVRTCRDAGVRVVDGACPLMFAEPVHGVHRLHRALSGRRIAA